MLAERILRATYGRASGLRLLRRPLDALRRRPAVRAFARSHVHLLVGQGSSWANVDGALRLLAEDERQRIVFGPWLEDPATELLYWVPFVRWAQEHFSLDPARLVAVSRGGVSHWYAGACSEYVDLLDLVEDEALLRPDDPCLSAALPSLRHAAAFGPRPLLELVERYRSGAEPPRPLLKRARHVVLSAPDDPVVADLPETYFAIALGSQRPQSRPDEVRAKLDGLIGRLARAAPVVSLDKPDGQGDDGVLRPLRSIGSEGLLRAQHALVAHATGVVASDPGPALLAALTGVPVIALRLEEPGLSEPDLDMALRVAAGLGNSFTTMDPAALGTLVHALGGSLG